MIPPRASLEFGGFGARRRCFSRHRGFRPRPDLQVEPAGALAIPLKISAFGLHETAKLEASGPAKCVHVVSLAALFVGVVSAAFSSSCSAHRAAPTAPSSPHDRAAPSEPACGAPGTQRAASVAECAGAAPLQCRTASVPGTPDALCAQLSACELGREPSFRGERIDKITRCSELLERTELPPESGLRAVAVVRLEGETATEDDGAGAESGQSAYLMVEREGRWCPVSRLLPFDTVRAAWLEDRFAISFDAAASRLFVDAQRVEHQNLDADERAQGVSDVAYEGCDQYVFALGAQGVRQLRSKWTTPTGCAATGVPGPGTAGGGSPRAASATPLAETPTSAPRCRASGPLGCELGKDPSGAALCAQLRACGAAQGEAWQLSRVEACGELAHRTSLPASTRGGEVGVLHVQGRLGARDAEAAYLVSQQAGGYCLIDQLFDATPDYRAKPAPSFELTWNDPKQRLTVVSRHGTSRSAGGGGRAQSVTEQEIVAYGVREGAFTRVQQQTRRELDR